MPWNFNDPMTSNDQMSFPEVSVWDKMQDPPWEVMDLAIQVKLHEHEASVGWSGGQIGALNSSCTPLASEMSRSLFAWQACGKCQIRQGTCHHISTRQSVSMKHGTMLRLMLIGRVSRYNFGPLLAQQYFPRGTQSCVSFGNLI